MTTQAERPTKVRASWRWAIWLAMVVQYVIDRLVTGRYIIDRNPRGPQRARYAILAIA
jgi:hypothetical protein